MRLLLLLTGVVIFIGLLVGGWKFAAGNATPVDVDLVWVQVSGLRLWRLVLLAIAAGATTATLIVGFAWLQGRLLNRRYRKTILRLEAELHQLRSLPLVGSDSPPLALPEESGDPALSTATGQG